MVTMKITVVCGVTPYSLVEVYQCFECTYYLHLQDGKADSTFYFRNNERTINSTNSIIYRIQEKLEIIWIPKRSYDINQMEREV